MTEGTTLILKKNSTKIRFDAKMANKYGEGFILTTKFYKRINDAVILAPDKQKPEAARESSHPTGRNGGQETRKYNNQIKCDAESSHKQAPREARLSCRRHDVHNRKTHKLQHKGAL